MTTEAITTTTTIIIIIITTRKNEERLHKKFGKEKKYKAKKYRK